MTDQNKFTIFMIAGAAIVAMVLASNTALAPLLAGFGENINRRSHYENVISRKGLSLHKGVFWKEKQ